MYIVGTFEHGSSLELAIARIENKGVKKDNIVCIPLDKHKLSDKFFDTIHRTDGRSTMGIPFLLATSFSLFGAIYGFLWEWGPIIWGGLGFLFGMFLGLLINYIIIKRQTKEHKNDLAEVVVIIDCREDLRKEVIDVLWDHHALGVGTLQL